jgi:hypothetical protein
MILKKFTIQTQDLTAIARNKLALQVEDMPSPFQMRRSIQLSRAGLCGEVAEDTFELCRLTGRGLSMIIINGWFEAIELGTLIHLEAKLNSTSVGLFLLACLSNITVGWAGRTKHPEMPVLMTGSVIAFTIFHIYSCHEDMRFYRKKLPQIFL